MGLGPLEARCARASQLLDGLPEAAAGECIPVVLDKMVNVPSIFDLGIHVLRHVLRVYPTAVLRHLTPSRIYDVFPPNDVNDYVAASFVHDFMCFKEAQGHGVEQEGTKLQKLVLRRARVQDLRRAPPSVLRTWLTKIWLDVPSSMPDKWLLADCCSRWVAQKGLPEADKAVCFAALRREALVRGRPEADAWLVNLLLKQVCRDPVGHSTDLQQILWLLDTPANMFDPALLGPVLEESAKERGRLVTLWVCFCLWIPEYAPEGPRAGVPPLHSFLRAMFVAFSQLEGHADLCRTCLATLVMVATSNDGMIAVAAAELLLLLRQDGPVLAKDIWLPVMTVLERFGVGQGIGPSSLSELLVLLQAEHQPLPAPMLSTSSVGGGKGAFDNQHGVTDLLPSAGNGPLGSATAGTGPLGSTTGCAGPPNGVACNGMDFHTRQQAMCVQGQMGGGPCLDGHHFPGNGAIPSGDGRSNGHPAPPMGNGCGGAGDPAGAKHAPNPLAGGFMTAPDAFSGCPAPPPRHAPCANGFLTAPALAPTAEVAGAPCACQMGGPTPGPPCQGQMGAPALPPPCQVGAPGQTPWPLAGAPTLPECGGGGGALAYGQTPWQPVAAPPLPECGGGAFAGGQTPWQPACAPPPMECGGGVFGSAACPQPQAVPVNPGRQPDGSFGITYSPVRLGLQNTNNTCYMNTCIQSLFLTSSFLHRIFAFHLTLKKNASKVDKEDYDLGKKLVKLLQRQMAKMSLTKHPNTDIWDLLQAFPDQYRSGEQQDVTETVRFIFDKLGGFEQPLIRDVFAGELSEKTQCQVCGNVKTRHETFSDLVLTVPPEAEVVQSGMIPTTQALLDARLRFEFLDDNNLPFCDRCQQKQKAGKWEEIVSPPAHLCICLSRFTFNLQAMNFTKEKTPVKVDGIVQIGPFTYELYFVIVHTGKDATSGHYYAIGRRSEVVGPQAPNEWVTIDDSAVKPANLTLLTAEYEETKKDDSPYVLFYRCQQAPPTPPLYIAQDFARRVEEEDAKRT